jgi:hypothetical protein
MAVLGIKVLFWMRKARRRLWGIYSRVVTLVSGMLTQRRITPISVTESTDQLGHGPKIRSAIRKGRLPNLSQLGGLGSEAYTDEVYERIVSKICDLKSLDYVKESLDQLKPLNHEDSIIHPEHGVDSAIIRSLLTFVLVENLLSRFDGQEVVEIGAGIATFAATVMTLSTPKRYTIYDLPDILELQKLFLHRVLPSSKFDRIRFCSAHEISGNESFDLVYSTYAFSELEFSVAEKYLENVVKQSKVGFMTYNHLGSKFHVRNMEIFDLCKRLLTGDSCTESIEIRADELFKLGAGGDPSCCNVLWRMR